MLIGLSKIIKDEIKSRKKFNMDYSLEAIGEKLLECGYTVKEITKEYKKAIK